MDSLLTGATEKPLETQNGNGFPFRLAAIDIDDTLVGPERVISAANLRAIWKLRSLGVRVLLASGRSHANMVPFHRELELDTPLISANGALLREVEDGHPHRGRILRQHGLPVECVTALIEEGRARGLAVLLYTVDGVVIDRETDYTRYDQSRNADPQQKVHDLLDVPPGGIPKLIWMAEPDRISALAPELTERYAGVLNVTHTDPEYLEFMPPGVSKAKGLAEAAHSYGVEREGILAFGDGNNDAEMLAWAGFGIAMPHAKPAAKAAADLTVGDGDSTDALARGIAIVLERAIASPACDEARI